MSQFHTKFCSVLAIGVNTLQIGFAAPQIEVIDVKTISVEPQYYQGWPTVAARANGELLLVFSGGRDYHVCPFGRLEMMRSRDGGESWTWPRTLLDSVTDDRDASILETAKGTLLASVFTSIAYQYELNDPDRHLAKRFGPQLDEHLAKWRQAESRSTQEQKQTDVGMWFLRSEDGGVTWSERLPAPANSPHGPIQLADGRLLYAGKELWTEEKKVGIWESSDDGISWRYLADLPTRPNETMSRYHELHAVEAADGTLCVQIRNHNNNKKHETLQTESHDRGKTWTTPHEIGVSGFPSHLLRLKDNTLLMTYGFRKEPFGIRGKTSSDNGQTWSDEFRITDDAASWDLGYPSTAQNADGTLVTIWYEVLSDSPQAVLRQARWRLK